MVKDEETELENKKYLIRESLSIRINLKDGNIVSISRITVNIDISIYNESDGTCNSIDLNLFDIYEESTQEWIKLLDIIGMNVSYYRMHNFTKIRMNKEKYEKEKNINK